MECEKRKPCERTGNQLWKVGSNGPVNSAGRPSFHGRIPVVWTCLPPTFSSVLCWPRVLPSSDTELSKKWPQRIKYFSAFSLQSVILLHANTEVLIILCDNVFVYLFLSFYWMNSFKADPLLFIPILGLRTVLCTWQTLRKCPLKR